MTNPIDINQTANPLKDLFVKVLRLKYFYIACMVIFLAAAFVYNRYAVKVYEVSAIIGPVDDTRNKTLSSNDLFRGLGVYTPQRPISNDITNLRSFDLVSSTVSSLDQEIGYYSFEETFLSQITELYSESPFLIKMDKSHVQPIYMSFYVKFIDDSTMRLVASETEVALFNYIDKQVVSEFNTIEIDTLCRFDDIISNQYFKFVFKKNNLDYLKNTKNKDKVFFFEFYDIEELTKNILENLVIGPMAPGSSMLSIQFSGENRSKIISFVNKYIELFIADNLKKKNKKSFNTVNFINTQLAEVSDSLSRSEFNLRSYRSQNQVIDLSFQGQRIYDQLSDVEAEREILELESRYYQSVIDYFKHSGDQEVQIPPMSSEIEDPIMNQLISDLIYLNEQKSGIINSKTEKSLFFDQTINKIKAQRIAINEHAVNNLNNLNISLNELNYRYNNLNKELSKLPNKELNLINMERKFTLDDAIYTYLLEKRSEAAITLASNYPDYELIEPARYITSDVKKPKEVINFGLALFFAFSIPTMFLILKEFFNDKITSPGYVERIVNRALVGIIPQNKYKTDAVVTEYPRSAIAESFRNLRSNLFFKLRENNSKIILLSSSQPEDGKSFISFNLATAIASVGYKTLIIDADTHRPTLHTKFKQEKQPGLSDYMVYESTIADIIKETEIKNLSFMPAGPVLANPAELIEFGVLDEMFEYLENEFDYILIDTPPTGIISDSLVLMRYASQILLVCRNNSTKKAVFSNVVNSVHGHGFEKFDVIFNAQDIKENPIKKYTAYYNSEKKSS